MSRINVDKITGKTGTNSGAPITLSGDTATLSGTGVTFPAGHVIQMQHTIFYASSHSQFTDDTQYLETNSGIRVSITTKYSNSMILVTFDITGQSTSTWGKCKIMRSYDGGSNFSDLKNSSGSAITYGAYGAQMVDDNAGYAPLVSFDFPNTTDEIVYNGFMKAPANHYWPHSSTTNFAYAMEIKQ